MTGRLLTRRPVTAHDVSRLDLQTGHMSRSIRTRLALTLGLAAGAVLPLLPAGGSASATYDPCNTVFLDWVYEDPADMMADFSYCMFFGWPPYEAPIGTWDWINDHSA